MRRFLISFIIILIIQILFSISSCNASVRSIEQDWKDSIISESAVNFSDVSPQCSSDTQQWLNSLDIFTVTSAECLLTKSCTANQKKLINDNLYAIQQFDAFGKIPSPGLLEISTIFDGSYQECERISGVKYETNYCYLVMLPGKNRNCTAIREQPLGSYLVFREAVCMPKSCGSQDLINVFNDINLFSIPTTTCKAYCSHRKVEKDTPFWGFSIFLMVIASIIILSTSLDYIRESAFDQPREKEKNWIIQCVLAFSVWSNAGQILSVKEQKPGFIKSLDCIRTISMAWVLSGHLLNYFVIPETLKPLTTFSHHTYNYLFMNAVFSVDTFFLLSGITVSYMFFKERLSPNRLKSPLTWILFYIHRYLRLTPPYIIFIGFFTVYAVYIQGPLAASLFNISVLQAEGCKQSWWRNLIYINNFDDGGVPCYGPSWYLATDTQLYLVAPILLVALYYSFILGTIFVVAGCVGSIVWVYILYSMYDMPIDLFSSDKSGKFNYFVYLKPWTRCTPYLVGIITGYLLANFGNKKVKLPWFVSVIGWVVSVGIACGCLFLTMSYDKGHYWGYMVRATYYNFSRLLWAFAVAWVITANHMGWGGPINNFMTHPIWQPFGRLSYCAYIVHLMVVYYFLNIGERPLHYYSTWQVYVYFILPATIMTFAVAFIWSLTFELPFLKLEKIMLEKLLKTNSDTSKRLKDVNGERLEEKLWN